MNEQELFSICPPVRTLQIPHQLHKDLENLKLKSENKRHEYPVFVDSNDLIRLVKRQVKPNKYKFYDPFDLLVTIHYRHIEFEGQQKYYTRVSRPIHYGFYRKEKSFQVKSDRVTDYSELDTAYNEKVVEAKTTFEKELLFQTATYPDILLLNRRLMPFNYRAMNRPGDRRICIFNYNWLTNTLG